MTTTAPAPSITVEETDTWIRHPSDVFTGDNREALTRGEWERRHEATYGERAAGQRAGLQNRLPEGSTPSSPALTYGEKDA